MPFGTASLQKFTFGTILLRFTAKMPCCYDTDRAKLLKIMKGHFDILAFSPAFLRITAPPEKSVSAAFAERRRHETEPYSMVVTKS